MSDNDLHHDLLEAPGGRLPVLWPILAFVVMFPIALTLDKPLAEHLHDSGWALVMKNSAMAWWLKFPGDWKAMVLTLIAAFFMHKARLMALVFSAAALLIPLFNGGPLKWIVGRHRPYKFLAGDINQAIPWNCVPFRDGIKGLFIATNLSFTSGHACMAFTLATILAILFPRFKILFFVVAALTACERFVETAHWLSDSVGGAGLGYFGVVMISRIKIFQNSLVGDCRRTGPAE